MLLSAEATTSESGWGGFSTLPAAGFRIVNCGATPSITGISSTASAEARPSASVACAWNWKICPGPALVGTTKLNTLVTPLVKLVATLIGPTPTSTMLLTAISSVALIATLNGWPFVSAPVAGVRVRKTEGG